MYRFWQPPGIGRNRTNSIRHVRIYQIEFRSEYYIPKHICMIPTVCKRQTTNAWQRTATNLTLPWPPPAETPPPPLLLLPPSLLSSSTSLPSSLLLLPLHCCRPHPLLLSYLPVVIVSVTITIAVVLAVVAAIPSADSFRRLLSIRRPCRHCCSCCCCCP